MRVLIVLALIGVACAETFLAPAPYAYSSYVYDEAKPSYEYSSSVQTPTYNNYAHVRSGGLFERKLIAAPLATPVVAAPVVAAAAEPIIAEAKYVEPAIAQPVLKSAPLSAELRTTVPFAATTYTLPSTKLLPITYEAKPFYRLAAPAPAVLAAAPAAQIVRVENKFAGEGKSQYHSQNELGEAQYGHRETFQAHDAVQDAAGNKAGSFSYVAPDGRVLTTEYIADAAGYRVASNALPSAPVAAPAFIQPVVGTVEKQAEIGESEIVVEAKSRSRRSVSEPKARSTRAIYPSFYSSPLAYSAPLAYSNSYAYSYPSYSAYSSFYRSPSLRTYSYPSYSYPSYAYSSYPYYRSFPFRK